MAFQVRTAVLVGFCSLASIAWAANESTVLLGGWRWMEHVDELTNKTSYSAVLQSTNTVLNTIGIPKAALMFVECEAKKDPYISISWPDLVDRASLGSGSVLVSWKFDENAIKETSWEGAVSSVRVPITRLAGFLDDLAKSQKLVLRIASQNAVFDLSGGDLVVNKVFDLCRIRGFLTRPKPRAEASGAPPLPPANAAPASVNPPTEQKPPPVSTQSSRVPASPSAAPLAAAPTPFAPTPAAAEPSKKTKVPIQPAVTEGSTVSAATSHSVSDVLAAARTALTGEGFEISTLDEETGELLTSPKEMRLTTKMADCGRIFGIPFLLDKRAKIDVSIYVVATAGNIQLRSVISGLYKTGMGAPDRPLSCTSHGVLEQDLLDKIIARP